jgi:predicted P-loop ATPase
MNTSRKVLRVVGGSGDGRGGRPPPSSDWRAVLTVNRDGRIEATLHNVRLILECDDQLAGLFYLDTSSNQILFSRDQPWPCGSERALTDASILELTAWLQHPRHYNVLARDDLVMKAVAATAARDARHPIRDYLLGLVWDGVPRVERMFVSLFGAEDRTYNRQAALCFMISAVARALWVDPKQPDIGAKVDFMLVLEDKQGKQKTTAMETLFGANWFVETMESPSSNEFYQLLRGCWGVEIAEMDSFSKADVTRVKGAITRRMDKYRAPYERAPRSWRRECVFVGTTNESEYLRDPTGGRRFLPVRILPEGEIQIARLREARDQLWAEAVALFHQGTPWWVLPDEAEEEQEARFMEDSWEGRIRLWLAGKMPPKDPEKPRPYPERYRYGSDEVAWTTTDELLLYAIGMEVAKHDRPAQMRIAAIMKRVGWEHKRREWVKGAGKERRWLRPADVEGGEGTRSASHAAQNGSDDEVPF